MKERINRTSWQPVLIRRDDFAKLEREHPELAVVDQYDKNLEELFLLQNPKYRFDKNYQTHFGIFLKEHLEGGEKGKTGNWFYYPWLNAVIHFLPETLHQELRTGRNRYLINFEEQKRFYEVSIGILGMSVGSHVAQVIAMTGGAKHIKIADPDLLSGDNLNRIRNGYQNVGTAKVILVARQIYEINPYARVEIFPEGLTEKNMGQFLGEKEKLAVLIEEMDHPFFKLKVRAAARALSIPVIMGTDNGDGVIVDIERFDTQSQYPILHGLIGKMKADDLKSLSPQELPKVAAKIAGANLAVPRMLESVTEVGRSIYSWPQLGTAANLCGTVVAYLARRIVNGDKKIKSGRYQVNLDSIFESDYLVKTFNRKKTFLNFIRTMMKRDRGASVTNPVAGDRVDKDVQKILNLAVYAPSGDNSQPWQFKVDGKTIQIFNLPEKDNPVLNFRQSGSYIAHGALIENILIAAPILGHKAVVNLFPDQENSKNLIATVVLKKAEAHLDPLYEAITERATNRRRYSDKALTSEQKSEILKSSEDLAVKNIEVVLVEDLGKRKRAGAAGSSIEQVILEDQKLHCLLFKDVVWSEKEERKKRAGLYVNAMEFKPPQRAMFWLARKWGFMRVAIKLGLPKFIARDDAKLYASGAAFGALLIGDENPETFINAGRVIQRVWLKATKMGLAFQPVTALVFAMQRLKAGEGHVFSRSHQDLIEKSYSELDQALGAAGKLITMPFRIGYTAPPSARTSRKAPDIILG